MTDARSADTEQQILDAAHRVFIRRGVDGARTQEIAEEAGVNKALLHYYFRTKDRLAEAVFLRATTRLFPGLMGALMADLPIADRVRQAVDFEMTFLEENAYLPGYILAEMRARPERMQALMREALPVDAMRPRLLSGLQQQLDREAQDGTLRAMKAEDFLVNLIALIVFPFVAAPMLEVILGLDRPGFDAMIERRKTFVADFVLNALRP